MSGTRKGFNDGDTKRGLAEEHSGSLEYAQYMIIIFMIITGIE